MSDLQEWQMHKSQLTKLRFLLKQDMQGQNQNVQKEKAIKGRILEWQNQSSDTELDVPYFFVGFQ